MFTPLKNLIVVEIKQEETRNGFLIPDQYRTSPFGIVKAVGTGKKTKKGVTVPIPLNVGDRILISDSGGRREIEYEGKKCWLMDADNILGILEEEELIN